MYKKVAKALESPYFDTSTMKRRKIVEYWAKSHTTFLTILLFVASGTMFFCVFHKRADLFQQTVLHLRFTAKLIINLTSIFYRHTFPLIDDVEYNLMIGIRLPFEYNTTLRYIFTYIAMVIIFNIISYLVIVSEVIMQAYLMPLICQYAILADCFENIFDDCAVHFKGVDKTTLITNGQFIDKYKQRLGNLVDQHLYILKQTMDMKSILSAPLLGQLCSSMVLICFAGYEVTACRQRKPSDEPPKNLPDNWISSTERFDVNCTNWYESRPGQDLFCIPLPMLGVYTFLTQLYNIYGCRTTIADNPGKFMMTLGYLAYNMYTLYLVCRWCEEITIQSQNIGEAAYFSSWEDGISQIPGVKATILIVISRANKPVIFFAGGMYQICLFSYTNLVKTSYSALNLLLRMRKE